MGFESFFNKPPQKSKPESDDLSGLRAEQKRMQAEAPQGFLENLTFTIKQMREKSDDEFWVAANEKLVEIVSVVQKNKEQRTYYKSEILGVLEDLSKEHGWVNYTDVDTEELKSRLHELYKDAKAGSPDDDSEPLKDMFTKD